MALRKGQAAVEYLIILAVVIIIALVVVGVLGGFPSLTRGVNEKESALYWQGSEVAIQKVFFTSATQTLGQGPNTITIRNNKNFDIRFFLASSFNMTDAGGNPFTLNLTCRTVSDCSGGDSVMLSPGDSKTFYVNTPTTASDWIGKFCTSKGDTFSRKTAFFYQDSEANNYTFVGTIALVTTCQ